MTLKLPSENRPARRPEPDGESMLEWFEYDVDVQDRAHHIAGAWKEYDELTVDDVIFTLCGQQLTLTGRDPDELPMCQRCAFLVKGAEAFLAEWHEQDQGGEQ